MSRVTIIFDNSKVWEAVKEASPGGLKEFGLSESLTTIDIKDEKFELLVQQLVINTGCQIEVAWSDFPSGYIIVVKKKK